MRSNHSSLQNLLRRLRLLQLAEDTRFLVQWMRSAADIRRFRHEYPDFPIPPAYLAFDAYNTLNYRGYREKGLQVAQFLYSLIEKYSTEPDGDVLEWGCGPGRIIRHLLALLHSPNSQVIGVDYNHASIQWCRENIHDVQFFPNELNPPLPFQANRFRAVYAVSVLTHLSLENAHMWVDELYRVLRPKGIAILTLHGDNCQERLLPSEKKLYETSGIVVRDGIQEGKKMYLAFHSPEYARSSLFRAFETLHHEHGDPSNIRSLQDVWVLRKP